MVHYNSNGFQTNLRRSSKRLLEIFYQILKYLVAEVNYKSQVTFRKWPNFATVRDFPRKRTPQRIVIVKNELFPIFPPFYFFFGTFESSFFW